MGKKDRMKFGLDSLFADNNNEEEEQSSGTAESSGKPESSGEGLMTVRISMVEPDKKQPRKEFDEASLSELADNISQMGVLQPLLVRPAEAAGRYTIVAGERRWRAARLAGVTEVPVIVRKMTDIEAAQIALIENIQREDLNPIEEAQGYKRLASEFSMTQEEIAKAVGKSRPVVANMIRLLELPAELVEAVQNGNLSVGHAKVLCGLPEPVQFRLFNDVVNEELNVRQLEEAVKKLSAENGTVQKRKKKKQAAFANEDLKLIEYALSFREEYGISPDFNVRSDKSVVMKVCFRDKAELEEFMKKLS